MMCTDAYSSSIVENNLVGAIGSLIDYMCKLFKEQLLYANLETLDC